MENDDLVEVILAILGAGLTITVALIGIIFSWLKGRIDKNEDNGLKRMSEHNQQNEDRFRSVYHELRDLRNQYDGLIKLVLENMKNERKD